MSNIKREDKFKKDQKQPGMGKEGGLKQPSKHDLGKEQDKKIDKSGW